MFSGQLDFSVWIDCAGVSLIVQVCLITLRLLDTLTFSVWIDCAGVSGHPSFAGHPYLFSLD